MLNKKIKTAAAVIMAAGVIGFLSACAGNDVTYARMCQEKTSQERVADARCAAEKQAQDQAAETTNLYAWYYVANASNYAAPSVGSRLAGGSYTEPEDGENIDENLPATGGQIDEDEDGVSQVQAPNEDEDNNTSVNGDDEEENNSGTSVSDDDDEDSVSGSVADDDE